MIIRVIMNIRLIVKNEHLSKVVMINLCANQRNRTDFRVRSVRVCVCV
jgi:hypothetical protein